MNTYCEVGCRPRYDHPDSLSDEMGVVSGWGLTGRKSVLNDALRLSIIGEFNGRKRMGVKRVLICQTRG